MILVPLPSIVEAMIAGKLTTLVSQGVAAILPMVGYPVDMTGNAMVVNGHVLDVAEGCSGLRSFQASLMLGIFLGEFYRLSGWQRLILAGVSVGLAFLGNGVRIYYLSTVAYREGPEAESKVHDTAGITAVTVVYALIGLTGWWLSREKVAGKVVITRKGVNS
jgi:exosortase